MKDNIINEENIIFKLKFRRKDFLIRKKYLEYIPVLFFTNLSTLLLMTVDGIVVGNFLGGLALAAVSMFTPIAVFFNAYIAIIAHGIADSFADAMVGTNSLERLYNGRAIKFVILVSTIVLLIIEFPVAHIVIHSYNLTTVSHEMTYIYTAAMLITLPFQLISTIGACQLEEIGKMNVLLNVSVLQSLINLILDIVFVGALKMGILGAGIASIIACIVRAMLTALYFLTKTNIYKKYRVKLRIGDVKEIVVGGLPYSIGIISSAVNGYLMLRLILHIYGESGGIVNGVCNFCLSIAMVFITSIADANGPLNGIFLSFKDRVAVRHAFKIAANQIIITVGIFTAAIMMKPEWFYFINGVNDIPNFGIEAIKAYSLCLLFIGFNTLFQGYFIDKKEIKLMSRLTFFSDILTPVVAYILFKYLGEKYFWYSVFIVAALATSIYFIRYFISTTKELIDEKLNSDILYLEVKQNEAIEASKDLLLYAKSKGYEVDLANDLAVCLEEMVKYAVKTKNALRINIQIVISFLKYGARFVMLDDGERINFTKKGEEDKIVTDNYDLVKKMAKSYNYQYVLNMNHITFEF